MTHVTAAAFWSYAHRDDENSGGDVSAISVAISREYELLTGVPLEMFRDTAEIRVGDMWRQRLDDALTDAAFLLPVLTPTYFAREECRKELIYFLGEAKSLGVDSLIIPILYVPVSDLSESAADELKREVARIQWIDWTQLRLEDAKSAAVRQGVNRIASRMAEAATAFMSDEKLREEGVERAITSASNQLAESGAEAPVEEPGVLDLLASMERVIPTWLETVEALPAITSTISELTSVATDRVNDAERQGSLTFARRVVIYRELAEQLEEPVSDLEGRMADYRQQLLEIDAGVRASIESAAGHDLEPDQTQSVLEGFAAIRELVTVSRESAASALQLGTQVGETARMSKDLRPVLNRLRATLQSYADAQGVLDRWEELLDQSGIEVDASRVPVAGT